MLPRGFLLNYDEEVMNWQCGYGHYEAATDRYTYVVIQQRRRGEPMWHAFMHNDLEPPKEVPGPLPLTRRQAMKNCEEHAKEYTP